MPTCLVVILACLTGLVAVRPIKVKSKSRRAADPLRGDVLALVLGDVEEGQVLGAEIAGEEAGEVAVLRRDLTESADGEAKH